MIDAVISAAVEIFRPPFRAVFAKTLGVTFLLLSASAIGLEKVAIDHVVVASPWLTAVLRAVAGFAIVIAAAALVTPVSFAVAGLFFDELADRIESDLAGPDGRGEALPIGRALGLAFRFGIVSLAVNAGALALLLVPGLNAIAFFAANAYLLGRGFFEMAALRYCPIAEVRRLRRRHAVRIFTAGSLCAALASIPILNLVTPLFATALLVRIAQPIVRRSPSALQAGVL